MSGRFDLFHTLDKEKQLRIMNAAMNEFAKNGFKRASTNEIVKQADIGKGMLFYYFGNKKELFDFLCEYTIEFIRNEYLIKFSCDTGDFVERYQKLTEVKRRVMKEFPQAIRFYERLCLSENEEFYEEYMENVMGIRDGIIQKLYDNLDYSLLRDDLEPQTTITYIHWLMDSYEDDLTARFRSGRISSSDETAAANEWEHFYSFLNDLRKLFYK